MKRSWPSGDDDASVDACCGRMMHGDPLCELLGELLGGEHTASHGGSWFVAWL